MLTLIMLVNLLPVTTSALETTLSGNCGATEDDNVVWNLTQNNTDEQNPTYTLTISGKGRMADYFYFGNTAPWKSVNYNEVTVEDGVTSIGDYAFYKSFISSIVLPESVQSIGEAAFNWSSLATIELPTGLSSIGEACFMSSKVSKITIPRTVNSLEKASLADIEKIYFEGDAIELTDDAQWLYYGPDEGHNITLYYKQGTAGWTDSGVYDATNSTWNGYKLQLWDDKANADVSDNIVSLFPQNNSTGVICSISSPLELRMVFSNPVSSLDFSKGNLKIMETATSKVVYSPRESEFDEGICYDITYTADKKTMVIRPLNSASKFEPSTQYSIEVDKGFINLEDGSTPFVHQGGWSFTTGIDEVFTFRFVPSNKIDRNGDSINDCKNVATANYADKYFASSSYQYNHDLATVSLSMAMAAMANESYSDENIEEEKKADKKVGSDNIKDFLEKIGMSSGDKLTIEYPNPQTNSIGYAIGHKTLIQKDTSYTLIVVAIRGGGYEDEWGGNVSVGSHNAHAGFQNASEQVLKGIQSHINKFQLSGNLKLWITGYSRAAAVANLTGAAIDAGLLYFGANPVGTESVIKSSDVYTYTFETPLVTCNKSDNDREVYNNIFNIINPVDPVTKVAPKDWGFLRYGVDYYLPSVEATGGYKNIIYRVSREYSDIVGIENLMLTQLTAQCDMLDKLLAIFADRVSRLDYSEKYEDILIPIVSHYMGTGLNDYSTSLSSAIAEFCKKHPKEALDLMKDIKKVVGKKFFWYALGEQTFEKMYHDVDSFTNEEQTGENLIDTATLLSSIIIQSHYPEVTLAWMHTIDDADGFSPSRYRKLYVNCPVDVRILDKNDIPVAAITGDEVEAIDGSLILPYIDGNGQKIVVLPADEEYNIELVATDDGTMSYTMTERSFNSDKVENLTAYLQLEIKKGDVFKGNANITSKDAPCSYTLQKVNDNNRIIEPSLIQSEEQVVSYNVGVTVWGHGSVDGGGTYVSGEYAQVTAYSGNVSQFDGWYIDGVLVSTDAVLRILVTADMTITAKFTNIDNDTPPIRTAESNNVPLNAITTAITGKGRLVVEPVRVSEGCRVTVSTFSEDGYKLNSVIAIDGNGAFLELTNEGNGKYTFKMPASDVKVIAEFEEMQVNTFADVLSNEWYAEAVEWAVQNGITNGVSKDLFAPNAPCTRGQIITFLWRASNCPEAKATVDMKDVAEDAYYAKAVAWANENGITNGTGNGMFSPDATCSRAQIVLMLYRMAGNKDVEKGYRFADVATDAYYADAVQWAVKNGITNGTTDDCFSPDADCTRAQVITFLHRYFTK